MDAPKRRLPPALAANVWRPGQSGNPAGHSGFYDETVRLAREAAPAAIRRLIELMGSPDERVASVACNAILDRAFGKPREYDPSKEEKAERPKFDPALLTPAELDRVEKARRQTLASLKRKGLVEREKRGWVYARVCRLAAVEAVRMSSAVLEAGYQRRRAARAAEACALASRVLDRLAAQVARLAPAPERDAVAA